MDLSSISFDNDSASSLGSNLQKTQRAKDRVRHGFFSYPPLGHQKSSLAQYPHKPRLFLHTLDVVCKHEQTKNNFRACNIFRLCFNNRKHDGNVLPVSYTCELLGHLSTGEKNMLLPTVNHRCSIRPGIEKEIAISKYLHTKHLALPALPIYLYQKFVQQKTPQQQTLQILMLIASFCQLHIVEGHTFSMSR